MLQSDAFENQKAQLESVLKNLMDPEEAVLFVRKTQKGNRNKNDILRKLAQEIVDRLPRK